MNHKSFSRITIYGIAVVAIFAFVKFQFGDFLVNMFPSQPNPLMVIHNQSFDELKKLGDFECKGVGGSRDVEGQCNSIAFYGHINKALNEGEARELIVAAANIYLKNIYENEVLQNPMGKDPFPIKNMHIQITMHSPTGEFLYDPYFFVVYLDNGKIRYWSNREYKQTGAVKEVLEETYEEALEKLARAKAGEPSREELTKRALER